MDVKVHILDRPEQLATHGAARLAELSRRAIAERGAFHVALAGGSTPESLYRELAERYRDELDWQHIHVYFGDERCVPPEHDESNFRMAREALLAHVPIPDAQVHRIAGEGKPEKAARDYAKTLRERVPGGAKAPRFDLVLLGMGPDGHTASLFPGTDILQRKSAAAAVYVEKLHAWRISVTLPVLNNARHVMILVAGDKKADVVRHVLRNVEGAKPLPIQHVRPAGELEWFLDAAAARLVAAEFGH